MPHSLSTSCPRLAGVTLTLPRALRSVEQRILQLNWRKVCMTAILRAWYSLFIYSLSINPPPPPPRSSAPGKVHEYLTLFKTV